MRVESKPLIRLVKFFVPFIIGFGVIGTIGLIIEENLRIKYWPLVTGYFFPPLGKETIIPSGVLVGIDPILMALSIAFVDIIVALFLIWNYNLAKKIPIIGKFMIKVEEKGKNVEEKYGWIKPLRFIGIMLFVMIPFQGSGGMVGSIVGRLVGMKPWNTFFAISIGAVIGCLLIAMFSQAFLIFAEINTTLALILVGIIATVIIAYVVIKRIRKK
ncbi:MAG: small multi-drug export protein [Thermoplasmatales archaeon]|nr:small multi-drug export protein [Thermoplasmatales archaeon]